MLLFLYGMYSFPVLCQYSPKKKAPNYFGFQYKPLIPISVVGDRPFEMTEGNFLTTVTPTLGYTFGGVVRIGLTELLAIETGLARTKRNFLLEHEVQDSSLFATNTLGFISMEIPVNFLVYIKLGNDLFMNTSMGTSIIFYPSNVQTRVIPEGIHQFIFEGRRVAFFSLDVNANVGFEYRTEKRGVFYLGMSGRIPLTPVLNIAAEYRYDTQGLVAFDQIRGATVSLDLKYFLPYTKPKGEQVKKGPIVQ